MYYESLTPAEKRKRKVKRLKGAKKGHYNRIQNKINFLKDELKEMLDKQDRILNFKKPMTELQKIKMKAQKYANKTNKTQILYYTNIADGCGS